MTEHICTDSTAFYLIRVQRARACVVRTAAEFAFEQFGLGQQVLQTVDAARVAAKRGESNTRGTMMRAERKGL